MDVVRKFTRNVNEQLHENGGGQVWDWLEEEVGIAIYLQTVDV